MFFLWAIFKEREVQRPLLFFGLLALGLGSYSAEQAGTEKRNVFFPHHSQLENELCRVR